jgi:hypothetical protein
MLQQSETVCWLRSIKALRQELLPVSQTYRMSRKSTPQLWRFFSHWIVVHVRKQMRLCAFALHRMRFDRLPL